MIVLGLQAALDGVGTAKETYLFALLGFLSVHGIPGADPVATEASYPAVLGCLVPPHARPVAHPAPMQAPRALRVVQP